jgi:transcriptional regulator with XRE-family HTH domain
MEANARLGTLVREERLQRNLDQRQLAALAGIDNSTVSRIENGRASASIYTAIRLCDALDLQPLRMIQAVTLRDNFPWFRVTESQQIDGPYLMIRDILTLLEAYQARPRSIIALLATKLNEIAMSGENDHPCSFADHSATEPKWYLEPKHVCMLLRPTLVYKFDLNEAPALSPHSFDDIYLGGGVVTLSEIGAYVRQLRRKNGRTQQQTEPVLALSDTTLGLLENAKLEQLRLAEILKLDDAFDAEGKLLGMYWRAISLNSWVTAKSSRYARLRGDPTPDRLSAILIAAHRWCCYLQPENLSWLAGLRHDLNAMLGKEQ